MTSIPPVSIPCFDPEQGQYRRAASAAIPVQIRPTTEVTAADAVGAAEVSGAAPSVRVLVVDPGEMDTALHRAALPDADPASLARPDEVARAIVELVRDPVRAPNGSRHVVPAAGRAA